MLRRLLLVYLEMPICDVVAEKQRLSRRSEEEGGKEIRQCERVSAAYQLSILQPLWDLHYGSRGKGAE